jgi:hypothetical protein
MKHEPLWSMEPLGQIDKMLEPCKALVPFVVLFTVRWNLLYLVYELRKQAVRDFSMRVRKGGG